MNGQLKVVFFDIGNTLVVSGVGFIAGALDTLTRLRQKGVRLGLISNTGKLKRAELLKALPANFDLGIFEQGLVVFSSEVKIEKPNPKIFEFAVKQTQLSPQDCLFCTEDLLDTLVAQKVGLLVARVQEPPASDIAGLVDKLVTAGLLPA